MTSLGSKEGRSLLLELPDDVLRLILRRVYLESLVLTHTCRAVRALLDDPHRFLPSSAAQLDWVRTHRYMRFSVATCDLTRWIRYVPFELLSEIDFDQVHPEEMRAMAIVATRHERFQVLHRFLSSKSWALGKVVCTAAARLGKVRVLDFLLTMGYGAHLRRYGLDTALQAKRSQQTAVLEWFARFLPRYLKRRRLPWLVAH